VRKQWVLGIAALILGTSLGCGSSGPSSSDVPKPRLDGGDAAVVSSDIGCGDDDSPASVSCRILNPPPDDGGIAVGGGTVVTRQNPVNYLTCKP
jgi:hypothetical protein